MVPPGEQLAVNLSINFTTSYSSQTNGMLTNLAIFCRQFDLQKNHSFNWKTGNISLLLDASGEGMDLDKCEMPCFPQEISKALLLMEEILHHMGRIKP